MAIIIIIIIIVEESLARSLRIKDNVCSHCTAWALMSAARGTSQFAGL